MQDQGSKKAILLVSIGGMLEFYDFIIYALLASYIAKLFFPVASTINGVILAFSAYAVGYLARPLGGIIFGHFGDKYGRKKTFTMSILIMAVSTLLIGCLPTYENIGASAAILLILLRLAQGFSVGGEIPGAISYVSEVDSKHTGLMTAVIFGFLISGVAIGFIVKGIMLSVFTADQIMSWAWRIPFVLGGIFGLIAYYLRTKLVEIKQFQPFIKDEYSIPLIKTLCQNPWNLFYSCVIVSFGAVVFVVLFVYLPTYITSILQIHIDSLPWVVSGFILLLSVLCVLVGALSDKYGRNKILVINCVLVMFASFAIYYIYTSSIAMYITALLVSSVVAALAWGNIPAMLCEKFSSDVKYSSIGFAYNIGFAVFGGLVPLIVTGFIKFYGDNMVPAYVLSVVSLITLITIAIDKKVSSY